MNMRALQDIFSPAASAVAVAAALQAGRTTARALAAAALQRAEQPSGEGRRVFTRLYPEWAMGLAELSDHTRALGLNRSPIEGLPVTIKDLFDVAGEATTAGSVVLCDATPAPHHALAVERLLHAGAVVIGKTNMTEFAYSGLGINPHFGTPANPWERGVRRIPGGSSAGAAVAVSDGMAVASVGSDTGGSVRIPAALCGLTGFKPTARRIPQEGVLPLSAALDSIGVIATDVDACLLLDAVLAGAPLCGEARRSVAGGRFAVPRNCALDGMDATVGQAFERALAELARNGAVIEHIEIPEFSELPAINAAGGYTAAEAWAWHADLLNTRAAEYDQRVASRIQRGQGISARDFIALGKARAAWVARLQHRLADFDALLMPTVPLVAPRIDALEQDEALYFATNGLMLRNTTYINFLDGCALSLPCHAPGQAPVGLMVAGCAMQDASIAEWARAIERTLLPITRAD